MKNVIKHPVIQGSQKDVRQRLAARFRRRHADAVDSSRRSLASLRRLSHEAGYETLRDLLPVYQAIVDELAGLDWQSPTATDQLAEISQKLEDVSRCVSIHLGSRRLVS